MVLPSLQLINKTCKQAFPISLTLDRAKSPKGSATHLHTSVSQFLNKTSKSDEIESDWRKCPPTTIYYSNMQLFTSLENWKFVLIAISFIYSSRKAIIDRLPFLISSMK